MYTLLLNKHWMPVDIITYKDCFRLLCKEHAKAMDEDYYLHTLNSWLCHHDVYNISPKKTGFRKINTVKLKIPVPDIIVLEYYDHIPKKELVFSKQNLYIRDEGKCQYCGCELAYTEATIDHIHPSSKGGESSWINCVIACTKCNTEKDAYMLHELDTHNLMNDPKYPNTTNPLYRYKGKLKVKESWRKFLIHI